MIHLKTDPKGIDKPIQRFQQVFYDKSVKAFDCDIVSYGRIYKDDKDGKISPQGYVGKGNYKDVLTDGTIKGLHFFFVEDEESEVIQKPCVSKADVDIIVFVNDISKVRGDIEHYADEEIVTTFKSFFSGYGLEIQSVIKGKKALDGFDTEQLRFRYPYFVFKIKTTINNY